MLNSSMLFIQNETYMKTKQGVYVILTLLMLFMGCAKDEPVPQVVQNLVGPGNRTWRLQEFYINGVPQVLTAEQKNYSKIYKLAEGKTSRGTVFFSDGYVGDWILVADFELVETRTLDSLGQKISTAFVINELTAFRMDVQHAINNHVRREVYYAN